MARLVCVLCAATLFATPCRHAGFAVTPMRLLAARFAVYCSFPRLSLCFAVVAAADADAAPDLISRCFYAEPACRRAMPMIARGRYAILARPPWAKKKKKKKKMMMLILLFIFLISFADALAMMRCRGFGVAPLMPRDVF